MRNLLHKLFGLIDILPPRIRFLWALFDADSTWFVKVTLFYQERSSHRKSNHSKNWLRWTSHDFSISTSKWAFWFYSEFEPLKILKALLWFVCNLKLNGKYIWLFWAGSRTLGIGLDDRNSTLLECDTCSNSTHGQELHYYVTQFKIKVDGSMWQVRKTNSSD